MAAKKVNVAEAFYIESHFGKKDAADIAKDLGLKVVLVQAYIDKLVEAGVKPPVAEAEKSNVEKAGFGVHDPKDEDGNPGRSISVVMTKAASERADEVRQSTPRNEKFFKERLPKSIHVLDPNKPVR